MSRVGKMPVTIPAGVDVSIKEDQISVKGSGGTLLLTQNMLVNVANDAGKLTFAPANESREANAMSGTMRQLVNNMVVGVSKGFEKKLSLVGVGYKAQAQGAKLNLDRGVLPSRQQGHACWHYRADADPHRNPDQGCRPSARGPGGCRDSCHSSSRALQRQGHPLFG